MFKNFEVVAYLFKIYVCVCVCVCGLVMLRNAIFALPGPGNTGMQKNVTSYGHSENVYLLFTNVINLKKGK